MKNVYLLLSCACVVATATAADKEMMAPQNGAIDAVKIKSAAASMRMNSDVAFARQPLAFGSKMMKTRAGEEALVPAVYFRPSDKVMSFGMDKDGSGYLGVGFASPYGTVDFWNFSTGVDKMSWTYTDLDDYEVVDNKASWNYKESDKTDLSVKSGVGAMLAPVLNATAGTGNYEVDSNLGILYCGGSPAYFMGEDGEEIGLSFYQNTFLKDSEGYTGTPLPQYALMPGTEGFQENGVSTSWATSLSQYLNGASVTDVEMQNLTIIQPYPGSAYLMSEGWIWLQVKASSATQLTSYIYPFDEDGKISDTPIAYGFASIPKGSTTMPVFYYNALNEDGDEIEGDVLIDSEVAITIEGFNGNDAITSMMTVSGYYPVDLNAYLQSEYEDVIKQPDLYADLTFKADGEAREALLAHSGIYYFDDTRTSVTSFSYAQFFMDAVFPWILSANGEESVTLPLAGGEAGVDVNALYYNIPALIDNETYEVTASDWVNVKFGVADYQTGNTKMTISAAATDADRKGYVEIKGLGLTYRLDVIQGTDNAVSSVVVEKDAQYFDLQGRRVANPEKGLYIKKTANKSEKVIL